MLNERLITQSTRLEFRYFLTRAIICYGLETNDPACGTRAPAVNWTWMAWLMRRLRGLRVSCCR